MEIEKINNYELSNTNTIFLSQIGSFWKGYEKSAYLFTRDIRPYQVKKKYVKHLKLEICSIGFPVSLRDDIKRICEERQWTVRENTEDKTLIIDGLEAVQTDGYETWWHGVSVEPETGAGKDKVSFSPTMYDELIRKIRLFSLANATPMQCMQFIFELQKEL